MNNQCLRFLLLMHLFKGLNITRKKSLTYKTKFCGSRVRATPPFLSAIQASKWVRDGAQAYLAYVIAELELKQS
jgi:hypothetical protein